MILSIKSHIPSDLYVKKIFQFLHEEQMEGGRETSQEALISTSKKYHDGLDQSGDNRDRKIGTVSRIIVEIEMTGHSHDDSQVFGFSNRVDSSSVY